MTPPDPQPAQSIHEAIEQAGHAWRKAAAEIRGAFAVMAEHRRRTVIVLLPQPDQHDDGQMVWSGPGWRVELAGAEITSSWDSQPRTAQDYAAALIAADRARTTVPEQE